ncbi:MAG TPA: DUF4389 domain-containing protein [Nitrospinota bacterium]|jgi:hypothetical protein|nr:DUF4389 domain-containing protein [Nitrospinota bacterium]
MGEKLGEKLTEKNKWIRGLYMMLFALIFNIAEILVAAIAAFQFVAYLFIGKTNEQLITFGQRLSIFIYQIIQFLTFNSEEKPYPFSPWPQVLPDIKKKKSSGERARKAKK